MTYESSNSFQIPEQYASVIFEALPGNSILVKADAHRFTILAATPEYITNSGFAKKTLIGKGVFEAFPANPTDLNDTGDRDLLASFQHVLEYKEPHFLPVQRYDLQNDDGSFTEKYWKAYNKPVFAPDGAVAYIIHTAEDITEQVMAHKSEEAHQELQQTFYKVEESEQRFRSLVTATSNVVYRMKADWSEMRELQGKGFLSDTSKPITNWLQKYIHPKDQQRIREVIQKAIETKSTFEMEHEVLKQDGTLGWTFSRAIPILDDYGNIVEWFGAAHDITGRKQAEEALRTTKEEAERQKRLYETITANTPDLIYVFDLNYRFTYANEALLAMWGKSWEESIGKGLRENGYEEWHAEMHEREIDQVVATRQPIRGVVSFPHAVLGNRVYDYIFVPVINADGQVEAIAGTTRDISEIKRSEEALKQIESNLRNTILQAPVAMAILRGDSFIVDIANDAMYELWGRGREELENRSIFEGLPEVKDQGYEELLTGVYTTGERFSAQGIPVTLPRKGAVETVYINLLYEALRAADGTISGVIAVAIDVTEQVVARKLIEATNQELQFVTDTMPQLVWATEANGSSYFFNKVWLEYTGLTLEEVKGNGWMQSLHPDDLERTQDAWTGAFREGTDYEIEYRLRRYDGVYRWFLVRGTPMKDAQGKILKWYGTTTDVHEQKLAEEALREREERFRFMVNAVPQSIWITDAEGRTEFLNQHWCDYCGVPYSDTTAADIAVKHLHPEDGPKVMEAFGAAMQTGTPWEVEQRNLSKVGEHRWFLNRAVPYKDPGTGKVLKWFGVGVDIHDRKLEEQALQKSEEELEKKVQERTLELEKANRELQRSNENLEDFAYAASHDLKEPVRKVHFFTDRLKGELVEKLTETQLSLFARIEQANSRMGLLIDDLLTYSQFSRGISKVETIDLNEKVRVVLEDLELSIQEKGARISVDLLPTIQGHQRQLQQLFQNLFSNALKYSRKDVAPHIQVRYRTIKGNETPLFLTGDEKEKIFHLIEVQDNGIGFEQKEAERIFKMFQRLHGKAEYEGTGIGLAIVQKVVENHYGYIWATSEPGKGSTFHILLP